MKIRAFITHKKAEFFKDCQDRFSINTGTKSVAVSDGMTQSYQQKVWAEMLVKSYTENVNWVPSLSSVRELSPKWSEGVKEFIQGLKDSGAPQYLIIMNENALASRKSAGATFCGIRFIGKNWKGDVLGDSCLIEITKNKILKIYSSQQGEEFDNHPDYFDSNPLSDGKGTPMSISGSINQTTSLIIVSDPFSDFLNEKLKLGNEDEFIKQLFAVNNHDEFEKLVADWRDNYGMHNDDSTMIIIEDDGSSDFNIVHLDDIQSLIDEEKKANEEEERRRREEQNRKQELTQESGQEEKLTLQNAPIIETPQVEQEDEEVVEDAEEQQPQIDEETSVEIVLEQESNISEEDFIKMGLSIYHNKKRKESFFRSFACKLSKPENAIKAVLSELYKSLVIIHK